MMEISTEDLDELLGCIDSLVGMMEPYYSQCGGADDANQVLDKYRRRQPYTSTETIGASCKICGKTFTLSRKNRVMDAQQQDTALTNHLISEHGIHDYKARNQYKIKSRVVVTHWDTYQGYLDSLNKGGDE